MNDGLKIIGIMLLIVLGLVLIALVPLLNIWALNTLFGFAIPFTFTTWFAAVVLTSMVAPARYTSKR